MKLDKSWAGIVLHRYSLVEGLYWYIVREAVAGGSMLASLLVPVPSAVGCCPFRNATYLLQLIC